MFLLVVLMSLQTKVKAELMKKEEHVTTQQTCCRKRPEKQHAMFMFQSEDFHRFTHSAETDH